MSKLKKTIYLVIALIIPCVAYAQKLPKIQTASVKAPANIKIDGKPTEWNNQFQAYNSGQHIYYTVANDDQNLYLTLQTDDKLGSAKVFRGGITFSIVPASGKTKLAVTYPAIKTRMDGPNILEGNLLRTDKILYGDTTNKAKMDSAVAFSNNMLKTTYKQIHVTGVPEIADPYLPIYNAQNIVVGATFDKKLKYTYEVAIPLKYLEAVVGKAAKFNYNIRLNSGPIEPIKRAAGIPVTIMLAEPPKPAGNGGGPSLDDEYLFSTTDFSGEYTLAK